MKSYPMRCKHCGGLLDVKGGSWQRFVHGGKSRVECSHCNKSSTRHDAEAMGMSFGARVDALEGELRGRIKSLPIITPNVAAHAMDTVEDQLRPMPGLDTLVSYILHLLRPLVLEQAHGRDTEIAVVGIGGATGQLEGGEAGVGVFGMVEDEKGVRQWEAMIARVGPARFVVCATAAGDGLVGEPSPREQRSRGTARESAGETTPRVPGSASGDPVVSATG